MPKSQIMPLREVTFRSRIDFLADFFEITICKQKRHFAYNRINDAQVLSYRKMEAALLHLILYVASFGFSHITQHLRKNPFQGVVAYGSAA